LQNKLHKTKVEQSDVRAVHVHCPGLQGDIDSVTITV